MWHHALSAFLMVPAFAFTTLSASADMGDRAEQLSNPPAPIVTVASSDVSVQPASPMLGRGCVASLACPHLTRTTNGWLIDTGGPAIFFDRFSDNR